MTSESYADLVRAVNNTKSINGGAENLIASIADVMCWFEGFEAGSDSDLSIDKETLRSLNRALKQGLSDIKEKYDDKDNR